MRQQVQQIFSETLKACIAKGLLPAEAGQVEPQIDAPKQAAHGDWATNVAMQLARRLRTNPRALAAQFVEALIPQLPAGLVVQEIAGRQPLRAVFRDSGFPDDAARINAEQVFRQRSPGTDVKTL